MTRELKFERAGSGLRALHRAEDWLVANGWSVSSRADHEYHFVNLQGPLRLSVELISEGRMRFTFAPGGLGVPLPAEAELARWVDACGGGPVEAPKVALDHHEAPTVIDAPRAVGQRCQVCAAEIPVGAKECLLCGMTV
ncbi:MAG: hypothetical protein U0228_07195 [Myxococcaceae bacterium]